MRRLAVIAAALLGGLVALVAGGGAQADSDYRVDAIFDTAKGIIPDQVVKIGGAKVGTIEDVELTPGYKARIRMKVDVKFAPFRSDARCQIQPEGLISENFVQCEPGTPEGRPLEGRDDEAPTVPVRNTSVPVSLTDLFNIWKVPVRDRFAVVLASLGAGVAGRGEDLNDLLRRASPTLSLVRRVTQIANRQRRQISQLVTATDRVVGELARRRGDVTRFVERADDVAQRTSRKRGELAEAVRRLPALLDAADPALRRIDELSESGRPLLADLRRAAPAAERLVAALGPFSTEARQGLGNLAKATDEGRRAIRPARPVAKLLRTFSRKAIPAGLVVDQLFGDLRQRGFVENLLATVYGIGATTSRYDAVSHIGPARLNINDCGTYATVRDPDCAAAGGSATTTRSEPRARTPRAPRRRERPGAERAPAPAPGRGPERAPGPERPDRTPLIPPVDPPRILDGAGGTLDKLLDRPPASEAPRDGARKGLLDFLLR